jgi:hypothetical protein
MWRRFVMRFTDPSPHRAKQPLKWTGLVRFGENYLRTDQ